MNTLSKIFNSFICILIPYFLIYSPLYLFNPEKKRRHLHRCPVSKRCTRTSHNIKTADSCETLHPGSHVDTYLRVLLVKRSCVTSRVTVPLEAFSSLIYGSVLCDGACFLCKRRKCDHGHKYSNYTHTHKNHFG